MAVFGAGKGMVAGHPATGFLVQFKHREVDHPQRFPLALHQTGFLTKFAVADLQAQRAHGVVHHFGLVGTEEQNVAISCTAALEQFIQGSVVNVLHDGRLQTVTALGQFVNLDPGQTFGTINADKLGVVVNFRTRNFSTAGYTQRHHAAIVHIGWAREHLEIHIFHDVGQFGEFHFHAQVGFV